MIIKIPKTVKMQAIKTRQRSKKFGRCKKIFEVIKKRGKEIDSHWDIFQEAFLKAGLFKNAPLNTIVKKYDINVLEENREFLAKAKKAYEETYNSIGHAADAKEKFLD